MHLASAIRWPVVSLVALAALAFGACGTVRNVATDVQAPDEAGAATDADREIPDASSSDSADGAPDAEACPGCGFWDPGLTIGTWRTDFDDPKAGLAALPLTLDACPFVLGSDPEILNGAGPTYFNENTSAQVACDRTSTTYPASNASTSAATWPLDLFWVVSANNERSFGPEGSCSDTGPNTGPPNQSKKVFLPGQGVFGIGVSSGKATLAIDTDKFPNCVTPTDKGKIPYLSLGAQTERGQKGRPITYLNDARYPAKLRFRATLEDIAPAGVASSTGKPRANFGYVFVEAQWGGLRRWAYIDLLARITSPPSVSRVHWNWNIEESMWYPGSEIIFLEADTLVSTCKTPLIVAVTLPAVVGASFDYSIDLNAMFKCLSDLPGKGWTTALPTTPLMVTGVHWAIEQTYGKNWTWMSIQNLGLAK